VYGKQKLQKSYSRYSFTQSNMSVKVTSGLKKIAYLKKTTKNTGVSMDFFVADKSYDVKYFSIVVSWTGKGLNFEHR